MRPGGGKQKGNAFELATCKTLSKWMTRGERSDLFARNVISGGSFTKAQKDGIISGLPGDIMANHPQAFAFLKLFAVECKHKASLNLDQFLFDHGRVSFLWKTFLATQSQAEKLHMRPMLIAKQDRRDTLVLVDWQVAEHALRSERKRIRLYHHKLYSGALGMFELNNFVMAVNPDVFIAQFPSR